MLNLLLKDIGQKVLTALITTSVQKITTSLETAVQVGFSKMKEKQEFASTQIGKSSPLTTRLADTLMSVDSFIRDLNSSGVSRLDANSPYIPDMVEDFFLTRGYVRDLQYYIYITLISTLEDRIPIEVIEDEKTRFEETKQDDSSDLTNGSTRYPDNPRTTTLFKVAARLAAHLSWYICTSHSSIRPLASMEDKFQTLKSAENIKAKTSGSGISFTGYRNEELDAETISLIATGVRTRMFIEDLLIIFSDLINVDSNSATLVNVYDMAKILDAVLTQVFFDQEVFDYIMKAMPTQDEEIKTNTAKSLLLMVHSNMVNTLLPTIEKIVSLHSDFKNDVLLSSLRLPKTLEQCSMLQMKIIDNIPMMFNGILLDTGSGSVLPSVDQKSLTVLSEFRRIIKTNDYTLRQATGIDKDTAIGLLAMKERDLLRVATLTRLSASQIQELYQDKTTMYFTARSI